MMLVLLNSEFGSFRSLGLLGRAMKHWSPTFGERAG